MSLVCAVPSFADVQAVTGQDVIVLGGGFSATRLTLEKVLPVRRGSSLFFRALLSGPATEAVRNGSHLARIGNHLVRLRLNNVTGDDGAQQYVAHAQADVERIDDSAGLAS